MTAFHLPTLFGPARLERPQADAGFLHGQRKGQREFCPVVDLNFLNGERQGLSHRGQEVETGAVILARIQAQDAIPRAVIESRVLNAFLAGDVHLRHIDLHTFAGVLFAEEDWVAGASRLGSPDRGIAKIPTNPADRRDGHPKVMDSVEPDARPHGPKLQVVASLLDEPHGLFGQPAGPLATHRRCQVRTGLRSKPNRRAAPLNPYSSA